MLIISNVTQVTQCKDLNPGLTASKARDYICSTEVPLKDSDVTHP